MTTKTRKVRIKRSKWLRGQRWGKHYPLSGACTMMCDQDGNMCCLGFAANQISGVTKNRMLETFAPSDVYRGKSFLTKLDTRFTYTSRCVDNNQFAKRAMKINDNANYRETTREKKLITLFAKNGIELEFVD